MADRIDNEFCRPKDFRGIAVRSDRLARNFLVPICVVAAIVYRIYESEPRQRARGKCTSAYKNARNWRSGRQRHDTAGTVASTLYLLPHRDGSNRT